MSGLLGVVLAGGEGRRMGGPKWGLQIHGISLVARAWNTLAPATGRVVLQGGAGAPPGLPLSPDLRPGEGPLAGMETALLQAREGEMEGVAVLAVDLPRVTAPVVLELLRRWREGEDPRGSAVIAEGREGAQPLVGIYGTGLLGSLSGWMDNQERRAVQGWLDTLGGRLVTVSEEVLERVGGASRPLLNLNRPEDVTLATALPPPPPPLVSVVGWKDSGKTSLAVALVAALRARGHRVMALKHGHRFHLDREGTDSYRLRHEGGAERVLLAGPEEMALMGSWGDAEEPGVTRLAGFYLRGADVVVVEGWKREPLPAVEVWSEGGTARPVLWDPEAPDRDRFLARVGRGSDPAAPGSRTPSPYGPAMLNAADPGTIRALADLVESRIIPGSCQPRPR